ncbi:sensor histidine kinase [Lawsonibacter faecis]|uniref:histidine kinase n=1 Tax=Lawsonibacter faecis TaxID=2763052 RepID=A0A8J6J7C8_9FIRM|nr:HAMP domain-containing sensor histidine kinase [Lawsonibacter faecis]MBC5737407.1 HAMP domain-containing protein [Lawsonibacter faecis]
MNQKTDKRPPGRIKSSIVLRLNTRLFFRLLGIYLGMDILLTLLFTGGMFIWSEQRCTEIDQLVQERGVPTAEATRWMEAGDYIVSAGTGPHEGWQLPEWMPAPDETGDGTRYFNPGDTSLFFGLLRFRHGGTTSYTVEMPNDGQPYAITLDLSSPVTFFVFVTRILLVVQLISLVSNLFKNAGTIKKTLRPIQELAAAAARLNTVSGMSPEELQMLAGKLNEINATHLDTRISVPGTQRELKTLATAINSMLDRINEAYRSQMRFVSDASHELRTPIAVIQGYANMLNRWGKDDPATRQEAIDAITAEAASMKELVEQLLFLARGDNESMHVEFEDLDLTAVAAEVLRETEMIDQTHQFSAQWEDHVMIHADMGLVKQAMRILVDNSIKYTPAGGNIRLAVSSEGGNARLTVQDEGQGIDAESLPHIFDRFYRTDQSRARQTGGTGLGLAIAKWIVDRHDGWFEVTSREGIGTRITVVIPLAAVNQSEKPKEAEEEKKLA